MSKLLDYFGGDELAASVWKDKYAAPGEETPDYMHRRMAKEFARVRYAKDQQRTEKEWADYFFELFRDFKNIIPQGRVMAGLGRDETYRSLSNCTVLPSPKDSYSSILYTDAMLVAAAKRGCGYGLDLSNLRPEGTVVKNAAGSSTGMASFMERYSNSTREVAQAGRRGACLLSIDVRHPDVDKFIKAKEDRTKVTGANISVKLTDGFMQAVEEDKDFLQYWPCDAEMYASDYMLMETMPYGELTELYGNPWKMAKRIKARELYDLIISHAHADAEPGVFFWDKVLDYDPSSVYEEFKPICTNACFTGDTLIAVADGRNAVSIKELADRGEDVTVYSVDPKTGEVSIQVGRHPRITGYNQPLVRVTLDDGSYLDVTPSHDFCLLDGTRIEAKDLAVGMSLPRFTKRLSKITPEGKDYFRINCNTLNSNIDKIFEHRLIAKFYDPEKWNKTEQAGTQGGFVNTNGVVVHHIDDDGLNNSIDNLEILTVSEHQTRHAKGMSVGENNGRYCGVDNDTLREIGVEYAKSLGRRFSTEEWEEFARGKGLPTQFSNYRGSTVRQFAEMCAVSAGLEYVDAHPFTLKAYLSALEMGYNARIAGSEAQVEKVCEGCGSPFWVPFCKRERGYCSASCYPLNTDPEVEKRRRTSRNVFLSNKQEETKATQAKIYSSLKFELGRPPSQKEWEEACKAQGIPRRIGKTLKFSYKNFKEVAAAGDAYNHKVVSVEPLEGLHTVYNITVDKNHTVGVITAGQENAKQGSFDGIFTFQCGEEPMSFGDTCRLLVINLLSIVKNPYTPDAAINWGALEASAIESVVLGDDLVDLEIEYAKRILAKVKSDPEPEDEKLPEIRLWERIIYTAEQGRRTGCGITGLGDMLAALGVKYDSPEALVIVEAVMNNKQYHELTASVLMAQRYRPFPAWNNDLEYPNGKPANSFYSHLQERFPKVVGEMQKYGRRAINWSTIAPTGSTSILAKGPTSCNISAGCEPQFFLFYTRKRKINPSEPNSRIDFTDQNGDHWMEYPVLMGGFKDWIALNTDVTDPSLLSKDELRALYEKSPWHNATANDIDWEARVKMQAILQKYTTAAISSCLTGDNHLVHTDEGLKYIEDIGPEVKGFNKPYTRLTTVNHKNKVVPINEFYYNGEEKTVAIELKNGTDIKGTKNHKLFVLGTSYDPTWKTLDEIEVGDYIVGRMGLECFGNSQKTISSIMGGVFKPTVSGGATKKVIIPTRMTTDLARLMGYLISDGHVGVNGIELSQVRNNVVGDFISIVKTTFGLDCYIAEDKRANTDLLRVGVSSRVLRDFFYYLGIKSGTCEKRVPKVIFEGCGRNQTKEFIKGLTLDGFVSSDKIGVMTTCSKRLARELVMLLHQFGIYANMVKANDAGTTRLFPNSDTPYATQEAWVVYCGKNAAIPFNNYIGFAEDRKNTEVKEKLQLPLTKWEGPAVPDLGLREALGKYRGTFRSHKLNTWITATAAECVYGKAVDRDTILYMHDIGVQLPEILLDKTFVFTEVTGKEYNDELLKTYDLSIIDGNSYLVNGIVSHNTLNLPEDISVEAVSDIYLQSWKLGNKGQTIYRDGSRTGVLVKDSTPTFSQHEAPKRPKSLPADLYHVTAMGQKWTVCIGLMEDKPYEVFASNIEFGKHKSRVHVVKKKKRVYSVISASDEVLIDNVAETNTGEEAALAKMCSAALRHGMGVDYAVKTLEENEGAMVSFSKAIARTLAKYTATTEGDKCPECGNDSLRREEGCVKCLQCNYSKC